MASATSGANVLDDGQNHIFCTDAMTENSAVETISPNEVDPDEDNELNEKESNDEEDVAQT